MRYENAEFLEVFAVDADGEEIIVGGVELSRVFPGCHWYELTKGEKKVALIRALVKIGTGSGTYFGQVTYEHDFGPGSTTISCSPIYFEKRGE